MRSPSALHQYNRDIGFFKSTKDFLSYLPPKLVIYCEARVIRLESQLLAFLNKVWDYCSETLTQLIGVLLQALLSQWFQDGIQPFRSRNLWVHVACREPESTRSCVSPVLETREEKQTQSHYRHGYSQLNRAPASSSVVKMVGLPDFTCPSSGSPFVFLFCSNQELHCPACTVDLFLWSVLKYAIALDALVAEFTILPMLSNSPLDHPS